MRGGRGRPRAAEKVVESLHTCPIPEVAKLGRTLRQWRAEILAYFDTGGVSNGGTFSELRGGLTGAVG
ncbi:transposase [Streptomyces sp. NPDC005408]|uniref:transposase n=1 Tax=Streptomyces sp. NPDC005408 TaxID=3155341 RepID=UPI0033BDD66F